MLRLASYPPSPHSGARQGQVTNSLAAMWVWLRLWFYDLTAQGIANALFPSEAEAAPVPAYDPEINRRKRNLHQHFARREAKGRPTPAARAAWVYRYFGDPFAKPPAPTQYLERLCRLSGHARVFLYRLPRHMSRSQREYHHARCQAGMTFGPSGVWAAHLWPG